MFSRHSSHPPHNLPRLLLPPTGYPRRRDGAVRTYVWTQCAVGAGHGPRRHRHPGATEGGEGRYD